MLMQVLLLITIFLIFFSLITHGFGTPAICAALSTFQTILSEMLNYLEKHSANKSTGTPDTNQINSNSDKTLRKTTEAQMKDGKIEKTEWLWHRSDHFHTSWSEPWWAGLVQGVATGGRIFIPYAFYLYKWHNFLWPQLSLYKSLFVCTNCMSPHCTARRTQTIFIIF